MLEAAVAGALAGYAIAVPVGAIAVLIIHIGVTHGLRAAMAAAAGAATADLVYATLAAVAGLGLTALIWPFIGPLRLVGGGVLVLIGAWGLLGLRSGRESVAPADAREQLRRPHRQTYLSLLGLTLLNPATVVYFTALTVGLPFLGGMADRLIFAAAAGAASLSWQLLLAAVGAGMGRGFGQRLRRPTALVGNLAIIGMGLLIAYQAL